MSQAEEMRELFARWQRSGESLMAFGKREGVSYAKLLYWRRKLEGQATQKRGAVNGQEDPALVPIEVVADPKPAGEPPTFEVWLSNGVSLNVSSGFDEGELRRLVGVLSSC